MTARGPTVRELGDNSDETKRRGDGHRAADEAPSGDGAVAAADAEHAHRHRQPDRRDLRARGHRRDDPGDGPAADQGLRGRLRPDVLRPGLHEHGLVPFGDHLHRRRGRHPRSTAAIPIEQLCEQSSYLEVAYLLVFGELPTKPQLERWVFDVTHHTFVHEDIKNLFETFRYDAHPMGMLLSGVGALSTFYPDAKHIDDPEERYMAAIRLIAKVPTLAAFAYRHNMGLPTSIPTTTSTTPGNFLSMLFKKTEVKYEPDPRLERGARRALHPPRRPRAELLDQRRARRRLLAGRPLLGRRRRRRRALRAAPRRRQRGGAADAAADRVGREHPRLPRGRQEPRGAADGLRPPRLQELRPAGADHPAAHGRGVRGDRVQPAGRDRAASSRSGRSTTSTSPRASSTRTSTSTRGSSTRRCRSRPRCSR